MHLSDKSDFSQRALSNLFCIFPNEHFQPWCHRCPQNTGSGLPLSAGCRDVTKSLKTHNNPDW